MTAPVSRARRGPTPALSPRLPNVGALWSTLRRGRPHHPLALALVRTLRNPMGAIGLTLLALLSLAALAAPLIAPFDPIAQHSGQELRVPAAPYLLGTDEYGRDILSRIIFGSRASLLVGVVAVVIGAGIGIPSGLLAGYSGGWLDDLVMRLWDGLLAFPGVLMGITVIAVLGPGPLNAGLALALVSMPQFSRLTRASVLGERPKEYVLAARCLGLGSARIVFKHILPNCLGPILVQLSLSMGFAVLLEAGLSFLGLGTQPPEPSWGAMLEASRTYLRQAPWYGVFPGVALAMLLVGLSYLSDALREALDPRRINVS